MQVIQRQQMNTLPDRVIDRLTPYLPIRECVRLHRCSKRLSRIVQLGIDPLTSQLAISWCNGKKGPPELNLQLNTEACHKSHLNSLDFEKLRAGLHSKLLKPFVPTLRVICHYCRFEQNENYRDFLDTFQSVVLVGDLYVSYSFFERYTDFCRLLDNVKANRYFFRTCAEGMNEYVSRYRETNPNASISLHIVRR